LRPQNAAILNKKQQQKTLAQRTLTAPQKQKKHKYHQGDIHRTATNIVYDIQISVFENLRFPVLHYKYDSPRFHSIFIPTLELKVQRCSTTSESFAHQQQYALFPEGRSHNQDQRIDTVYHFLSFYR